MAKRNNKNDNEGSGAGSNKIPRMNEEDRRFDFPNEPELLPEEWVVAKHELDRLPSYIPFRAAGTGTVFIQRRLLVQLYEKEANVKVTAGAWIEVPYFPKPEEECSIDDWKENQQTYWKEEIGSFLHALDLIGEPKKYVVSPFWYISVNWASLKTICAISGIAHDAYIQEHLEEEYEWHFDSEIKVGTEEFPVTDSVKLIDLYTTDNHKIPAGEVNTSIWLIDSRINYWHLEENESDKVYPSYYEYSSDDLQDKKHEVSNEGEYKGDFQHGTIMCKTMCAIASNRTSIHFVKFPQLMNNEKHILQSLHYILETATTLRRKWNIILMTLGTTKFRCRNDQSLLYVNHHKLHREGFIFICSAGNVKFPTNIAKPLTEIPEYPLSFFLNCASCVVVGAHALESNKACLTTKFESSGCCTPDKKSDQSFKQGIHTLAIGENVVFRKTKYQENDSVRHGTSIASAVVAASATYFVPKLLTPLQYFLTKNLILSKKFKELLESSSDIFVCSKHGTTRKLIFNFENIMKKLKYEQID